MTIVEDVRTVCKKHSYIFWYEGLIYTLFINPISLCIYYDYKYLTKKWFILLINLVKKYNNKEGKIKIIIKHRFDFGKPTFFLII